MKVLKLQSKILTRNANYSFRSCKWQTEDHENNTSTNSRRCLAATSADQYKKNYGDSDSETHKNMLTLELKQKEDTESQTSSTRGTSPQESLVRHAIVPWKPNWEHTSTVPQRPLRKPLILESKTYTTANRSRCDKFPPAENATSMIEERLARDETTNEFYMALPSTIVLKRKAVYPSGIRERSNNRCITWLKSLCECNSPKWTGQNQTKRPHWKL